MPKSMSSASQSKKNLEALRTMGFAMPTCRWAVGEIEKLQDLLGDCETELARIDRNGTSPYWARRVPTHPTETNKNPAEQTPPECPRCEAPAGGPHCEDCPDALDTPSYS